MIDQRVQDTSDPSPAPGKAFVGPVHALLQGLTSSLAVIMTTSALASLSIMASFETLCFLHFGNLLSFDFAFSSPWPTMGSLSTWQLTHCWLHIRL